MDPDRAGQWDVSGIAIKTPGESRCASRLFTSDTLFDGCARRRQPGWGHRSNPPSMSPCRAMSRRRAFHGMGPAGRGHAAAPAPGRGRLRPRGRSPWPVSCPVGPRRSETQSATGLEMLRTCGRHRYACVHPLTAQPLVVVRLLIQQRQDRRAATGAPARQQPGRRALSALQMNSFSPGLQHTLAATMSLSRITTSGAGSGRCAAAPASTRVPDRREGNRSASLLSHL